MRALKLILFSMSLSIVSFSQENKKAIVIQTSLGYNPTIFTNYGLGIRSTKVDFGIDIEKEKSDLCFYLSYGFNKSSSYRGHYLGLTFENHFLSKEKRFRPYFGLSFMTEVATNYKEGFLSAAIDNETSFLPSDNYSLYSGSDYYKNKVYHSGFYYSTPFFGTASLGFDLRLIKDLHLNFSLGYGLQLMRYKYFQWKSNEDYRELLKSRPMKSRKLHYVNAELGLRYEFSFGK